MKFIYILLIIALKAQQSINLLTFTTGSTNGYVVALSLPLGRPESNIYMSYNFEANYALVTNSTSFTQGFYDKIYFIDGINKTEAIARMQSINFFSRTQLYRLIEGKLDGYGFSGKECLLRLICEAASSDLISNNGIIGSFIHILLTPSSSNMEIELNEYVDAEKAGEESRGCREYKRNCRVKIIDLFSKKFD
ncbi:hypothetical protein PVAND_012546 [Polypedilum vanderplanki]|uniref:Uncharacterized protein n=1 Tax=Polypedilum vanderplanki TaxID=319348 RepID=A0A9J6CNS0_POLVA|nr:hypothetical protein PVAND_012546 [Polypedilum vanderplanki]